MERETGLVDGGGVVGDLVERLAGSLGPLVLDDTVDTSGWVDPPASRESWVDLQGEVAAVAAAR